jgi:OPA family glycerol-3-phosphate transporter-like MFS transporter 3
MFDYGSFLGGVAIGFFGDHFERRALFLCPSLAIAAGIMLAIRYAGVTFAWFYYVMILSMGFFFGGPYNNISGVISIDLTKNKELKGNK